MATFQSHYYIIKKDKIYISSKIYMRTINVNIPLFSHYEMQITKSFFKLTIHILYSFV